MILDRVIRRPARPAIALPWDQAPQHLLRDRDASYGAVFKRRLNSLGIRDHPTAPRSPWQNGYAEREIGSIRRECLDHTIIFGEAHLRRTLKSYAHYYNRVRTHLSLAKDAPIHRPVQHKGTIYKRPHLSGLHHEYARMDAITPDFPTGRNIPLNARLFLMESSRDIYSLL